MIGYVKKKLIVFMESLKDEIEDTGGIKIFMLALLLTILFTPFLLVYELIIKPLYSIIRVLIDAPKLGIKNRI